MGGGKSFNKTYSQKNVRSQTGDNLHDNSDISLFFKYSEG